MDFTIGLLPIRMNITKRCDERGTTRMSRMILIALAVMAVAHLAGAQHSVLHSGTWHKLAIEKSGVYKINYDLLKKMGFNPANIDPRKIRIYGNTGGMLPQSNLATRPDDLTENAIFITGESDGKFDKADYILFYAEGPDEAHFDHARGIFHYQNNLYSDRNFYFLTVSNADGKRIQISINLGEGYPVVREFNDFVFYEADITKLNDPKSGREWYGEKFGVNTLEHRFTFPASGILPGSTLKVVSDVLAQSYTECSFNVSLNNVFVKEQELLPIPNSRYAVKGIHNRDTFQLNASDVSADVTTTQEIKFEFNKTGSTSEGYLDFFLISFTRRLALYENQTAFVSAASLANPVSQFEVNTVPADALIWDITDPSDCKQQEFSLTDGVARFAVSTTALKEFIVVNKSIDPPILAGPVNNQDLHAMTTPEMVIVTHPDFVAEAERLAMHRGNFNQWNVQVVTTDQIYNEFSSGRQDVSSIRDFAKHLYDKSPATLKSLLLFGRASYDYKDRLAKNTNFVITYESRNSLNPLETYSSDDYFGFLEANEGEWRENPAQNHTLDIGVGRLPVTTGEQARSCVDKIIDYDTNKRSMGFWRKQIVFVADDGNSDDDDSSLHQIQADQLAHLAETLNPAVDTRKLFMGSYPNELINNREVIPKLEDDIVRSFDRGSLIINYTGHGSERQWGDEKVFSDVTIDALENKLYPFLVTATCEFGRHDDPAELSAAEQAVTHKQGGVIGLVTTARPVNASTNFNLNQAFYEALFQQSGGRYETIGEVFKKTKNNSVSAVANRNFSLLGDPSLTLALPPNQVHVTMLKTATGSDTLKALSTVVAKGEIRNFGGEKLTSFNGTVEMVLFDKETHFTTTGKNDPPVEYKQWHNALFRGKASVVNGEFQLAYMIPKNIAYPVAPGKFSLYASDPSTGSDAIGAHTAFKIGESEPGVVAENNAPRIRLFMGDTTFINGGITTPDTWLVASLKDDSGINISGYGIGNNIIAVLDNDVDSYILNDYYVANTDDPTSGWIHYPIKNLSPGKHRLTVRAWDVFNTSAEATIDFIVTDGEALVIEAFGNYPNPFHGNTTLFFTHNRSGDDLQAQVFIHSQAGEIIKSGEVTIIESDYKVDLLEINTSGDVDKKLPAGLYLARVIVRSLTNGSKNEQVTKLIVLN